MNKQPTMHVHVTYPEQTPLTFWRRNSRMLLRSLFVFCMYASGLVNLCVGGKPWALAVIGGLMVLWIAVFYRPLVEHTLIKKLSDVSIAVCAYLFLLDWLFGRGWSDFVVPIVFFADLLGCGFYFLLFFKKQKRNFLPLFELVLAGMIGVVCALAGLDRLDWPMIVVGSVSLALVILTLALYFKPIMQEVRKKFHM